MPVQTATLVLPARPPDLEGLAVAVWEEPVVISTYRPHPPDRYPAYLDQRVYQGSSGRVYPLPLTERIDTQPVPVSWRAIHLENEWLRLMVLPDLGGRIHVAMDRTNDYDLFYRNNVIKPALVGLAGPWIAGGVEFNWPQHHRPATYLPVDTALQRAPDGTVTVWCSDHDPFTRMKGMHGIRLRPNSAAIEVVARLYNRDAEPRTFLWWANVAARAHEDYQSFFPPDVSMVADHARRDVTGFPAADRPYYGIDYAARHTLETTSESGHTVAGDRIDWYRNIPVPTSYMCLETTGEFFGGYDHRAGAGFVHVADRQIAVGKKQWTWGQAPFGRAWDHNLADDDAAYVELMAGVFSDNQPDFSFIAPGETKVFSHFWYPIRDIGPVYQATTRAAVSRALGPVGTDGQQTLTVGVACPEPRPGSTVHVRAGGQVIARRDADIGPGQPLIWQVTGSADALDSAEIQVLHDAHELVTARPLSPAPATATAASRPPAPHDVSTVEELHLIGQHLAQYRHATISPDAYWQEARRRDPGHAPTCTALAIQRYRAGRYAEAEELLRTAISRLTRFNGNPADTSAHYYLGLTLRRLGRLDEAYDAFGKAMWNRAWRAAAGYQLAILDAGVGRNAEALERLEDVRRSEPEHLQAGALTALLYRRVGRPADASRRLAEQLLLDPLDWWARDLAGQPLTCDAQTRLDIALAYTDVSAYDEALRVLDSAWAAEEEVATGAPAARPLIAYQRARILERLGRSDAAGAARELARSTDDRYCFPSRLDDVEALEKAVDQGPDPRAEALLGHWAYDSGRRAEAIGHWRHAVDGRRDDAVSWRNLGVALYHVEGNTRDALACYDRAVAVAPGDARLWFERDQLAQRAKVPLEKRVRDLEQHLDLVTSRDDSTIALVNLYVNLDRLDDALAVLADRPFQPWEGGEGPALRAWERVQLAVARRCSGTDQHAALQAIESALFPPRILGEQRHPLANAALLHLVRGDILARLGRQQEARRSWNDATQRTADFVDMAVRPVSDVTFACAMAYDRLHETQSAEEILHQIEAFCREQEQGGQDIDYFATSRPITMVFPPDQGEMREQQLRLLRAQTAACRGETDNSMLMIKKIISADPGHSSAHDLIEMINQPGFFPHSTSSF